MATKWPLRASRASPRLTTPMYNTCTMLSLSILPHLSRQFHDFDRTHHFQVLLAHPDIAECAVVGVSDPEWGQKIGMIFTAATPRGGTVDTTAVIDWAAGELAGYKLPRLFLQLNVRAFSVLHRRCACVCVLAALRGCYDCPVSCHAPLLTNCISMRTQ